MLTPTTTRDTPDSDLWQRVREGSAPAFEVLVQRHQALVCAVAYNACGNLALSEDVAQETFWTAWRERAALAEPARLRGWLCGIARNIGHNVRRRAARPAEAAVSLDGVTEAAARTPGPPEELVSREEETLLWQTLEQIPESYREPLILFYREQQPVAEVAAALDLSVAAVKQRLSRGREMLRDQMAELVEGVLQRSRPGRGFTIAVMSGLTALSAGAKTALAGTGAAASGIAGPAWKAVAATGITGAAGGVLGALLGLLGGWFGVWLPAQTAPTKRERNFLLRMGLRMFLVSLLFTILLFVGIEMLAGRVGVYLFFWAGWMLAYLTYVLVETLLMVRGVKRIRADLAPAEPNDTRLRAGLTALASRYRGRVYRSRATFLGLPLIDVNVSDPRLPGDQCQAGAASAERRKARGWIAIGDDARGILLAVGCSTACGFVAIGGRSLGVLSFGGIAVGLVSLGGLALGGLALGGCALGGLAFGGLAIGWQAYGGGALAWDVACGGAALAHHAALGGAAFAHDFAVGGHAEALHANDEAARALLLGHPLVRGFQWYLANAAWLLPVILIPFMLGPIALFPLLYRREKAQ